MSHPFDRRLADDPPVHPERVMPIVAGLLTVIVLALIGVGLVAVWPAVAAVVPASAAPLAASTALFLVVLAAAARAVRRATPDTPR